MAQSDTLSVKADSVFTVDAILEKKGELPQFIGGDSAWFEFIRLNYAFPQCYKGPSVTPVIRFVVEKDGTVSNVTIIKGEDPAGKEMMRVISMSPKWKPGIINGNPVAVTMTQRFNICPQ